MAAATTTTTTKDTKTTKTTETTEKKTKTTDGRTPPPQQRPPEPERRPPPHHQRPPHRQRPAHPPQQQRYRPLVEREETWTAVQFLDRIAGGGSGGAGSSRRQRGGRRPRGRRDSGGIDDTSDRDNRDTDTSDSDTDNDGWLRELERRAKSAAHYQYTSHDWRTTYRRCAKYDADRRVEGTRARVQRNARASVGASASASASVDGAVEPPPTPPPPLPARRPMCARCDRPTSVCYCDALVAEPMCNCGIRIAILVVGLDEGGGGGAWGRRGRAQ